MTKNKKRIEIELKFRVFDPIALFRKIGGAKPQILYIKDKVYGTGYGIPPKIRERTIFDQDGVVRVNYEKTRGFNGRIKKVLEEKVTKIPDGFNCENSYEKIRYFFDRCDYKVMVDFYPIGVFCEIEGNEKKIKEVAVKLGFDLKDNISRNIDTIYREEAKLRGQNDLFHWGFGKIFWDTNLTVERKNRKIVKKS